MVQVTRLARTEPRAIDVHAAAHRQCPQTCMPEAAGGGRHCREYFRQPARCLAQQHGRGGHTKHGQCGSAVHDKGKITGYLQQGVVQSGGSGNRKFYNAGGPAVWQWANTDSLSLSLDFLLFGHFENVHNSLVRSASQVRQWQCTSHSLSCLSDSH